MEAGLFIAWGAFWCWKALLSRATTTGVGNQFFQGVTSRYARGALSHAAAQSAAALPCALMGIAFVIPGLLFLAYADPGSTVIGLAAVYFVVAQVAGLWWAVARANHAARVTNERVPDQPARY